MVSIHSSREVLVCFPSTEGNLSQLKRLFVALDEEYALTESTWALREDVRLVFRGGYFGFGNTGLEVWEYLRSLKENNKHQVTLLLGNAEIDALRSARQVAAYCPKDVAQQNILEEKLAGRTKRKAVEEDIVSLPLNGYMTFIAQFCDGDFDKSLALYSQAINRNGDLRRWMQALEPLHTSNVGRRILFAEGDGFPDCLEAKDMRKLMVKYDSLEKQYRQDGVENKIKNFTHKHFHTRCFAKREYVTFEAANKLVEEIGIDLLVTGLTSNNEMYLKHPQIVRMGPGFSKTTNGPNALVIREDGFYKFNLENGEEALREDHAFSLT